MTTISESIAATEPEDIEPEDYDEDYAPELDEGSGFYIEGDEQ